MNLSDRTHGRTGAIVWLLISILSFSQAVAAFAQAGQAPSSPHAATIAQPQTPATPAGQNRPNPQNNPNHDDTITLETRLVELNVKVSDRTGRGVADLTKEDFTVYEDGVAQPITIFDTDSAPINLVLMLDFSGSTEDKRELLKDAAAGFVDTLKANDRLAVVAFTHKYSLVAEFSSDRERLKKRIRKINKDGGSAVYDSLWRVFDLFKTSRLTGRKAIVLLTDGIDDSITAPVEWPSKHSYEELLARVTEESASIYPIYLDTEAEMVRAGINTPQQFQLARHRLAQLADQTGGRVFLARQLEDLAVIYQQVADELRTIYSLGYHPTNNVMNGSWRRIRVVVNRPGIVARTRRGYFAR